MIIKTLEDLEKVRVKYSSTYPFYNAMINEICSVLESYVDEDFSITDKEIENMADELCNDNELSTLITDIIIEKL